MIVESCPLVRWKINVDSYLLKWIISYTPNFFNLAMWYLKRSVSRDISGLFWHGWTDPTRNKDLRKTNSNPLLVDLSFLLLHTHVENSMYTSWRSGWWANKSKIHILRVNMYILHREELMGKTRATFTAFIYMCISGTDRCWFLNFKYIPNMTPGQAT
jgi:hypothetical protein